MDKPEQGRPFPCKVGFSNERTKWCLGLADVPPQRGIIPRVFDHIFMATSVTESQKFLIHCSYLEVGFMRREIYQFLDL